MARHFKTKLELQAFVWKVANGAIKSAIEAHGPIMKSNYGSVGKRIAGHITAKLWEVQENPGCDSTDATAERLSNQCGEDPESLTQGKLGMEEVVR